jgi:hypothetical protein
MRVVQIPSGILAMKSMSSDPEQHIPSCTIRGRLIPAYDILPRLNKLCLSLGFNTPIITKLEKLAPPEQQLGSTPGDDSPLPHGLVHGHDSIIVLSTKVPYEQNWGGYSGLPDQHNHEKHHTKKEETPSDFIHPYLQQYQFAQTHIHLSCNSAGQFLITLPDFLIQGQKDNDPHFLKIKIAKIAEPNSKGQFLPLVVSGALATFAVAPLFRQAMDTKNFPWKTGRNCPIGEYLSPEYFCFTEPSDPVHRQNPFSSMLSPQMPWIVAHKTPHLAATLIHLQSNFFRVRELFAATGPDDLRNLLCVAGLDIDMKGFRGRTERYFVPWQSCWKRHGHCYGNIYPLLQNDLFVALMNVEGISP